MKDNKSLFQQLVQIPKLKNGMWDVCAQFRDKGEILLSSVNIIPYSNLISWDASIKISDGSTQWYGDYFARNVGDEEVIQMRFSIGTTQIDLTWDGLGNISILPMMETVI